MRFEDQSAESNERSEAIERAKAGNWGRDTSAQVDENKDKTEKVEEGKKRGGAL